MGDVLVFGKLADGSYVVMGRKGTKDDTSRKVGWALDCMAPGSWGTAAPRRGLVSGPRGWRVAPMLCRWELLGALGGEERTLQGSCVDYAALSVHS